MTSRILGFGPASASPAAAPSGATRDGGLMTRDGGLTAVTRRAWPLLPPLLLCLLLAALTAPVSLAQSPRISLEAGADTLNLDRSAIASAEIPEGYPAVISGNQDLVPLLIRFVPTIGSALEAMTARHLGETITIRIDGAIVSQPVIREAVTTGGIIITNIDRRIAEAVISAAGGRIYQQ